MKGAAMSTDPETYAQELAEAELEAREYADAWDLDQEQDYEDEPELINDHEGELEQ
jgi:hypothetical protein